jgi:hypothetical protein
VAKIRVIGCDIHLIRLKLRLPFRYGIATMTEMPHLFLRAHVEFDGQRATGISADCLPVKWFTKIPSRSIADEITEMLMVIEHAAANPFSRSGRNFTPHKMRGAARNLSRPCSRTSALRSWSAR